jgi:hypothetical protein
MSLRVTGVDLGLSRCHQGDGLNERARQQCCCMTLQSQSLKNVVWLRLLSKGRAEI